MEPVRRLLEGVLDDVRNPDGGRVADYIPELARAAPDRLAVAVAGPAGGVAAAGDADLAFHPIDLEALRLRAGPRRARPGRGHPPRRGRAERRAIQRDQPGAADGAPGQPADQRRRDRRHRNRALAHLLRSYRLIDGDPHDAVEAYFRQCSLLVTVGDLAVMAATLAFGGRNPVTGERVITARTARDVVSVMTSCGMYDGSGSWLLRVGLPAKSGVSGGIIAVAPSQFGVGVMSPRLDVHGNSTRGSATLERLSEGLGMHVFDEHEAIAAPRVAITRDDAGGVRVTLDGELSFSGAERVLARLRGIRVDIGALPLTIDLRGVTQMHPAALAVVRQQVAGLGGSVQLED